MKEVTVKEATMHEAAVNEAAMTEAVRKAEEHLALGALVLLHPHRPVPQHGSEPAYEKMRTRLVPAILVSKCLWPQQGGGETATEWSRSSSSPQRREGQEPRSVARATSFSQNGSSSR